MPTNTRVRQRRQKPTSTKLSYLRSPGGYSSSEGDYPQSHHITEATPPQGNFNLPHSSPDNSEESSDGWSDNEGISSDEGTAGADDRNGLQDLDSTMVFPHRDGLLLVSDDENFVDDDDDYLSDPALSLNAFKKPPLQNYDETKEESSVAEHENSHLKIPSCVALRVVPHEPDLDIVDPVRNYDARYDGNLQDLMKRPKNNLEYVTDEEVNDDDNDSDSYSELSGYLSTGESRGCDCFLIPYVGERPPTPPSPRRFRKPKSYTNNLSSSQVQSVGSEPPSIPMMDYNDDGVDFDNHYAPSAMEQIHEQDAYNVSQEAYESDNEVPYGDYDVFEQHHDYVDDAQCPTISRVTSKDEESAILVALANAQKKDRRLIRILTLSLGGAFVSLAAVIGGVVALKLFGNNQASAASAAPIIAPVPASSGLVQSPAPAATPQVASSVSTPSLQTQPTIAPLTIALTTNGPIQVQKINPTRAPATKAPALAPSKARMQAQTAAPTIGSVSVTVPSIH